MNVHIYAPESYYIGQVRRAGCRKWMSVTSNCKSAESEMSKAVLQMKNMKRARVLMIATNGYLEPLIVMECKRC